MTSHPEQLPSTTPPSSSTTSTTSSFPQTQTHELDDEQFLKRYEVVKELKPWTKHHTKVVVAKDNDRDGRMVAVKVMNLLKASSSKRAQLISEMEMLKLVKGQAHIIELVDLIQTEKRIYLVMEYVESNLLRRIREKSVFTEDQAWKLFHQLYDAISFLHQRSIFHANLKLENILFDENTMTIKLIDFGSAKVSEKREKHPASFGNPGYIAPEAWLHQEFGFDGFKNDVYGMGVILYAMLFGTLPFDDTTGFIYYSRLKDSKTTRRRPDLHLPKKTPKKLQRFLNGLLAIDPKHRYSLTKISYSSWFFYDPAQLKEMKKEMKAERKHLKKGDTERRNSFLEGVKKVADLVDVDRVRT